MIRQLVDSIKALGLVLSGHLEHLETEILCYWVYLLANECTEVDSYVFPLLLEVFKSLLFEYILVSKSNLNSFYLADDNSCLELGLFKVLLFFVGEK